MWSLRREKLKIQAVLEDFTEGGFMFPSSKTSYFEENTKTSKENKHFSTDFALKSLGTRKKRLGA